MYLCNPFWILLIKIYLHIILSYYFGYYNNKNVFIFIFVYLSLSYLFSFCLSNFSSFSAMEVVSHFPLQEEAPFRQANIFKKLYILYICGYTTMTKRTFATFFLNYYCFDKVFKNLVSLSHFWCWALKINLFLIVLVFSKTKVGFFIFDSERKTKINPHPKKNYCKLCSFVINLMNIFQFYDLFQLQMFVLLNLRRNTQIRFSCDQLKCLDIMYKKCPTIFYHLYQKVYFNNY